jgi:uncharacterized DUF497 family protein
MKLEWDEEKRRENSIKHGLDFADAWQMFEHPLLTFSDERFDYDEIRSTGIGFMNTMVVAVVVFSERDPDIVRVISLRKAKKHEKERYERAIRN